MRRRDCLVGAAVLLAGARSDVWAKPAPAHAAGFADVLAAVQAGLLEHEPEQATILGFADIGADAHQRLGEYGAAGRAARRARLQEVVLRLGAIPEAGLGAEDRTTRAVILDRARGWLDLEAACGQGHLSPWGVIWGYELYPINQISGLHIGAPSLLINYQPLATRRDATAYLNRMAALGPAMDGVLEEVQADAARRAPPRQVIAGAMEVIDAFLAVDPDSHPLVASFEARLVAAQIGNAASLTMQAAAVLRNQVYPAYQRMREALGAVLQTAPEPLGLAHWPQGQDLYQKCLWMQADTRLPAEEVHRIGLEETSRLASALDVALREEGLDRGGLQERLAALTARPSQRYESSDAGRQLLLEDLQAMVREAELRMASVFEVKSARPPAIRRIPPFLEAYASGGGGQPPSMNGQNPGVYVINLKDMSDVARWSLPALTYHEASPGHIYEGEVALGQNLPALRLFLARSNAFAEGWGLYAEALAAELGLYAAYPAGKIGWLQSELFRAVRLVIDTGLHHYGWSFEEAVARMVESGAATENVARREVLRYAVWPGQAVGYKLGQLEILAARERMRRRHGERFDLRVFHSRLLNTGGLPIPQLTGELDRA